MTLRFSMLNPMDSLRVVICILLVLPFCALAYAWLDIHVDTWQHLINTRLYEYLVNSLVVAIGVGMLTTIIGTLSAWCVSQYAFTGKSFIETLLVLPLAVPAYILAYSYYGIMAIDGPFFSSMTSVFGRDTTQNLFFDIRSRGGAIFILAMSLYPYVFLIARSAFMQQSPHLRDAARSLGKTEWQYFFKIALPIAKPAIIVAAGLTMIDALADFGAVAYFGVSTLTTGIYRTWTGMGDMHTAIQLGCFLVIPVFVIYSMSSYLKPSKAIRIQLAQVHKPKLQGFSQPLIIFMLLLAPMLGFIFPMLMLIYWASFKSSLLDANELLSALLDSISVAVPAMIIIVIIGLLLAYDLRFNDNSRAKQLFSKLITSGYALPGLVIAAAILLPLTQLDHAINHLTVMWFDYQPGLVLSGSLFTLIIAYLIRFIKISMDHFEKSYDQIPISMDQCAASLGCSKPRLIKQVHFPILLPSILSSCILVLVEVIKELPATLMLRPFNFQSLSIQTFELAKDERLVDASYPALVIILFCMLSVFFLIKSTHTQHIKP